jgi:hypothetical protein
MLCPASHLKATMSQRYGFFKNNLGTHLKGVIMAKEMLVCLKIVKQISKFILGRNQRIHKKEFTPYQNNGL